MRKIKLLTTSTRSSDNQPDEGGRLMFAKRILLAFIIIGAMATVAGAQSEVENNTAAPAEATQLPPIRVNCDAGQTIRHALRLARPGHTILVRGTCRERITITKNRLTLDGQGSAILDGGGGQPTELDGLVTIDGVQGVTIKGFTIQNGPGEGILGLRGAAFTVRNSTVRDNGSTGVAVGQGSTAELSDCRLQHNGGTGMDVYTGSSAVLKGTMDITDNSFGGIDINGTSIVEVRGSHVQASRNGTFGVIAATNSQLAVFGFAGAAGSTLTVDANVEGGFLIGSGLLNVFAETTITVTNSPVGIFLGDGFIASPFGQGKFLIRNNGTGLNFGAGSGAIIVGGLNVQNNGTGLLADAAGTLTFVSIPPNPSSITGNTDVDVNLSFGTRSTINAVAVGTITCDATVLSRGTTVCP